jgi:hypothetical protein
MQRNLGTLYRRLKYRDLYAIVDQTVFSRLVMAHVDVERLLVGVGIEAAGDGTTYDSVGKSAHQDFFAAGS